MLALVKKHPVHFAVLAACAYPIVKVATGGYDHLLLPTPSKTTTTETTTTTAAAAATSSQ